MGNSLSGASNPKGKKVAEAKLESSKRTGVLNLVDLELKASSSIWMKLQSSELIMRLTFLDISNNPIKVIPLEVYSLSNLKTLIASNCSIQRTYDISMLERLQTLRLDNNDLEADTIGALPPTLKHLNLSANHCTFISNSVLQLPNLVQLELNGNRINTLMGIGALQSLIELHLDDNALCEVPEEIGNLTRLKILSLQRNEIGPRAVSRTEQSIPAVLFLNTCLDSFHLAGNVWLSNKDVFGFDGVDHFLARRKSLKDKALQGGALIDSSLFGLDG